MTGAPLSGERAAERFVPLDGLRGVAASVVAIAHGSQLFFPDLGLVSPALWWLAREAVVVFFVISGFSICMAIRTMHPSRPDFAYEYALRRACRIVPPLVFAIVVSCAAAAALTLFRVDPLVIDIEQINIEQFVRGITLTYRSSDLVAQVDGPLWSLRLEIILYVLAGTLALSLVRKGFERWGLMAISLLVVTVMAARLWFAVPAISLFTFGALATVRADFVTSRLCVIAAAIVFSAIVIVGCFLDITTTFEGLESTWGQALQLATGACLALLFASIRRWNGSGLSAMWHALAGVGAFSYTLYIVHYPSLKLLEAVASSAIPASGAGVLPRIAVFLVSLAGVFVFAAVSARVVEKPQWYRQQARRLPALWRSRRA